MEKTQERDDDFRTFYQELQKLRIKKSGAIDQLFTFFLTSLVLIWSFLGKAYVDKNDIIYILIAFVISAFLIGFWRCRTHTYDKAIQRLYPDLVFCEMMLEIPEELGLKNFLINNDETNDDKKNKYKEILNDPTPGKEKKARDVAKIIAEMVEEEKIPNRGHDETDFFAFVLVTALFILTYSIKANKKVIEWYYEAITVGVWLIACGFIFTFYLKKYKWLSRLLEKINKMLHKKIL